MKQYIVTGTKAICAAQGEKLPKGTIKDESYFADGQIAELKGRGMIAEYSGQEATKVEAKVIADTAETTGKSYSKMNLTELKDAAVDKGIDFAPEVTKAQLIALLSA